MTDVRVVVRGDDITFAGTEVELNKMQTKVRERYDFKVRGTLGSAGKYQQYNGIVCRTLRWADDGLVYEADENLQQALLRGLNEASKIISSAAVKAQDIDPQEDEEFLETGSAATFRTSAATLMANMSVVKSDVHYVAKDICTMMDKTHAWKLNKEPAHF